MTKLSDTQTLILSAAAQREGNVALPLPTSLRGGAATKVVDAMLAKGLLAETTAPVGALVWSHDDADRPMTLVATKDGLNAIGVEPEVTSGDELPDAATQGAQDAPNEDAATNPAAEGDTRAPGAPTRDDAAKAPTTRTGTKQAAMIDMLRRPDGATIAEIAEATGWQHHTVRGAFAGALKKKLGLDVQSEKVEGRGRVYRLPAEG